MIFDSHAHYDDEAFDKDRDCLLSTMEEQGVGCIVNVGASFQGGKGQCGAFYALSACLCGSRRASGSCR